MLDILVQKMNSCKMSHSGSAFGYKLMGLSLFLFRSLAFISVLFVLQNCCKENKFACKLPRSTDSTTNQGQPKLLGKNDAYTKIPGNDPYQCNFYGCDARPYPVVFYHSTDESFPFLKGFKPPGLSYLDVNNNFHDKTDVQHWGIDMRMASGQSVRATGRGTARVLNGGDDGCGLYVVVEGQGDYWYYCHLSGVSVTTGQAINIADQVGASGNSGNSTGPHLHYAFCPFLTGDKFTLSSYCRCPIGCGDWNPLGPNP